tara:strand:- start:162 stop:458 length:297 start_codon:yes stop_codon:yes gene_type:complete
MTTCNRENDDNQSTFMNFAKTLLKTFVLLVVVVMTMALKNRLVTQETTMFYTALFVIGGTVLLTIVGTVDSYVYSNLTLGLGLAMGLYLMDWRQPLKQ